MDDIQCPCHAVWSGNLWGCKLVHEGKNDQKKAKRRNVVPYYKCHGSETLQGDILKPTTRLGDEESSMETIMQTKAGETELPAMIRLLYNQVGYGSVSADL